MENWLIELEIKNIECDKKENLIDYMWLFNNIPWSNHDGAIGKIEFTKPTFIYYLYMNGYDNTTSEIKQIEINNVIITAFHGFGGNSFEFNFKMGDDSICLCDSLTHFDFNKEDLKKKLIAKSERKIINLEKQTNNERINIERVKIL